MNPVDIIDLAMRNGAVWAGVEPIGLMKKDCYGVAISFPGEFTAEEFMYNYGHDLGHHVTRDQEFVLVWLGR